MMEISESGKITRVTTTTATTTITTNKTEGKKLLGFILLPQMKGRFMLETYHFKTVARCITMVHAQLSAGNAKGYGLYCWIGFGEECSSKVDGIIGGASSATLIDVDGEVSFLDELSKATEALDISFELLSKYSSNIRPNKFSKSSFDGVSVESTNESLNLPWLEAGSKLLYSKSRVKDAKEISLAEFVNAKEAEEKENVERVKKEIIGEEVDKMVEGDKEVDERFDDSLIRSQEDPDTRIDPGSHKESLEVEEDDDDDIVGIALVIKGNDWTHAVTFHPPAITPILALQEQLCKAIKDIPDT
nr:hypothetical protein [Tanacetum cinerariifolium]